MNREGAETFLRLAAEAELRGQLAPAPPPWAGSLGAGRTKVMVVGRALTAVGALEGGTVESILADLDLAVSVRQISGPPSRGRPGSSRNRASRNTPPGNGVSHGGGPPGRPDAGGPARVAGPGRQGGALRAGPDHRITGRRPNRSRPTRARIRVRPTGSSRWG